MGPAIDRPDCADSCRSLVMIRETADRASSRTIHRIRPRALFVVVVGYATLLVTALHGTEASIWAAAYLFLGAFADYRHAMLYSLNAITSYGHTNLNLGTTGSSWED
jgi:integral membrane sensor domain MASE1